MNNKKIGICALTINPNFIWDETNYDLGGIGNSEIWVIKISEEFAKNGYDVYVFGNPKMSHVSTNGVKYYKTQYLIDNLKDIDFDYFIATRFIFKEMKDIKARKKILIPLEADIINCKSFGEIKECGITGIGYFSDYQKEILKKKFVINENIFFKIIYGIDFKNYDEKIEKRNKMVFSSGKDSGLYWFLKNVFPRIRKDVPDFEVDIFSAFDSFNEIIFKQDGINILSNVNNKDISKRQLESKIWIYPNHGYNSTFDKHEEIVCLPALENCAAKNACILSNWGCCKTTMDGYEGFVGNELIDDYNEPIEYEKLNIFANEIAEDAIKCLKDESYRNKKAESAYKLVQKYTWENAYMILENEFENAEKSLRVYVLSQKETPFLIKNETFVPLQLGAEKSNLNLFEYKDNIGEDNISAKNRIYSELSGIYWVWKNSKNFDYIGNENYRRHFNFDKDEIIKILSEKDIIVGRSITLGQPIYGQYKYCHIIKDLDTCLEIVKDLYPEYGESFDKYLHESNRMFYSNSFITSNKLYNDINEFAFSVLFELEKRYGFKTEEEWREYVIKSGQQLVPPYHVRNGLTYVDYQMLIMAFLYERLISFYIIHSGLKSYEVDFENLEDEYRSKTLKTMLICIGRLENQYIREFVEFYESMGVTNICLCDNNRDGEDDFHDVIGDYINNGFVILKDYRNAKPPIQAIAYNNCYHEYKNDYDWFLFFDIDEFMFINKDKDIKSYLGRKMFEDYDMIHVNWLNFGDGGYLKSNGRPLMERIQQPIDVNLATDYNFPDNFHVKSIVRGGLDYMEFQMVHTPKIHGYCCTASGEQCDPNSPFQPYDYRFAGIRHYTTKTAEEFAEKLLRGFCDTNTRKKDDLIRLFFKRNVITEEKVNVFKEICGIDVSYLLPNNYNGKKDDNIKIYSLCYDKKEFQFLNDAVITPLQVGASNGKNVCELKDNTLDNISDKNYFFVEGTGTYWIWKNVKNCKYKGQMQYRRPLSGVSESMDFEEIFKGYDVITCKPFNHPENSKPTKENPMCIPAQTVEGGYGFSNCLDDLLVLEMAIKMYHSDYAEDYDKYIKNGENLYYSNGFILKAEDFDRYAEFMFDCLNHYLELTNIKNQEDLINHVKYNLEVGKYIRYKENEIGDERIIKWQSEIGGFLSERIWTLWLQHNFSKDRIYELPYIKMENNMYT